MKGIKALTILISPFIIGWIALFLGAYGVSPLMVLKILLNETLHVFDVGDIPEKAIIVDIRLPRVLLAGLLELVFLEQVSLFREYLETLLLTRLSLEFQQEQPLDVL
jgi:ABC-type Fe3+-siderophore transport system permease subunit